MGLSADGYQMIVTDFTRVEKSKGFKGQELVEDTEGR
jgi:hypothetical protein